MSSVRRRVLIQKDKNIYKVGDIIITIETGDVYYVPSQKKVIDASTENTIGWIINHVSWHKSGTVHIKDNNLNRFSSEKGVGDYVGDGIRQKIQDIGYQRMLLDTILNIDILPKHKKKTGELDIVFKIRDYHGPIQFDFSIVSGREIINTHLGKKTSVHQVDKEIQKERILDIQHGCLGVESDNADKLLQFVLNKYIGNEKLPTGRRMFIPNDSGIKRSD